MGWGGGEWGELDRGGGRGGGGGSRGQWDRGVEGGVGGGGGGSGGSLTGEGGRGWGGVGWGGGYLYKFYKFVPKYFDCLPFKIVSYELFRTSKMISEAVRIFYVLIIKKMDFCRRRLTRKGGGRQEMYLFIYSYLFKKWFFAAGG